ncbi:YggS family pyridoxal phosphate-dependent enzyme [Lujinxingia sediminis]|uniref:Pyridoxal phosphate homeostasis protein n=1 Tax=Lujinxingia sediminis TaxID=2480984 RepID=A0ABY0CYF3_9DELT|nr:YggS family pyridoxal phosphate-dependent enzyme [Lujinxingia sediminis]RVU48700.1 YggS family pyridoxal phosphate-dependent enzyme [Lujinxingia sediminis]
MSASSGIDRHRLKSCLDEVEARIQAACARAGRERDEVTLIAVSKTHPIEAIEALADLGVSDFGESYVQEWQEKARELEDSVRWHFIGGLQSNKARFVAGDVALIHSVDRKSLVNALARRSEAPVNVLLQVNISGERSKGGVEPEELNAFYASVVASPELRVCGVMGMAPYADDPEDARQYFRRLRELFDGLVAYAREHAPQRADEIREISMGMSGDFEVAIEEGATLIRVGSALFGERHYDA